MKESPTTSKKRNQMITAMALSTAFVLVLAASVPSAMSFASATTAIAKVKADTDKISKDICITATAEKTIIIGGTLGAQLDKKDGKEDGQFKVSLNEGDTLCLTIIAEAEVFAKLKVDGDCIIFTDSAEIDVAIKKNGEALVEQPVQVYDNYTICITEEDDCNCNK